LKYLKPKKIVLIGASTGGPGQIHKIIQSLPKLQNTSIIIAQHMSDGFLKSFVESLNQASLNSIELVKDDKNFQNQTIYVCENSTSLIENKNNLVFFQKERAKNSFNPDINLIFNSCSFLCSEMRILTIILTGIGDDGVQACVNLNKNGARCMTESSQSAIIDGMPSRARELVSNIEVLDIKDIIKEISEFCE
jgi:two-component system chemotaxis response regulator CheB